MEREASEESETPQRLAEGVDFYFDEGLMVLTEAFLKKRGYCCENGCRHCPYSAWVQSKNSSNSL